MENLQIVSLLCGVLMLTPAATSAVTIYKVTDADGKVTYQNHPPFRGAERVQTIEGVGRVETLEIDLEQNLVPSEANRPSRELTLGRSQTEDAAAIIAIDGLAKRNYAAGAAAAMEDAAGNGINNNGIPAGIEGLGALPPGNAAPQAGGTPPPTPVR